MRSVTRLRRNPCISSIGGRNTITATTGGRYEQEASRLQVSDPSLRPVRHKCAPLGIAHPHSSAKSHISSTTVTMIRAERREPGLLRDEDVDALSVMYSDTET